MQVLVYHQNTPFNPALMLLNDNCKVWVYADKLTKVATIELNESDPHQVIEKAFGLTQHDESLWYENPDVICHQKSRSSGAADIFYVQDLNRWYMCASLGWWQEGDRWRFEGNPPVVELAPRPYDAVLGTGTKLLPGSVVLSPNQGKCKSRLERHTLEHIDPWGGKWEIDYIPIRTGWRVEVKDYERHYWGTKVFSNPIAAEQNTVNAINKAVELCLEEEIQSDPLLTGERGFIDTAEENIDGKIPHEFYQEWFIYTNWADELALYDPQTNECHELEYEGTLEEAIDDAKAFIDKVEYDRHVSPGQLALFDLKSF
jgi:hypothetical protein